MPIRHVCECLRPTTRELCGDLDGDEWGDLNVPRCAIWVAHGRCRVWAKISRELRAPTVERIRRALTTRYRCKISRAVIGGRSHPGTVR